jgi:hypothetical protein
MAYSVFLHIWILTLVFLNTWNISLKLLDTGENFLAYIFNALLLNASLLCGTIPVLMWTDCPRFVQHMNRWAEFQVSHISLKYTAVLVAAMPTV